MAVSLLVAFLLAGNLHGPAGPAVCSSTALLAGDLASVTAVGAALRQRGIHGTRAASCAGVRVTIARCDAGLRLERTNPSGRITARVVATADTAALLIESWLRTDIAAPLLAAHEIEEPSVALPPPPVPAAPPAAPPPVSVIPEPAASASGGEAPVVMQASAPAASHGTGTAMAMLGEAAVVHDGSRAWGGSLSSCVAVRAICVGLTARLARLSMVTDVSDLSRGLDTVDGYDTEGLIGADVPLRFGRLAVRPGGGAGVGWVRTRGPFFEHRADFDSVGLRAEARLDFDLRVSRTLALELGLSGGAGATSTIGRVEGSKDKPMLVSHLSPLVRAGLGFRFGGAGP